MTTSATLARIDRLRLLAKRVVDELDALRDEVAAAARMKTGQPDAVIEAVATVVQIDKGILLGPSRIGIVVRARNVICLALHEVGMPYAQIGRHIERDHSTVINAVRKGAVDVMHGANAAMLRRALDEGIAAWTGPDTGTVPEVDRAAC